MMKQLAIVLLGLGVIVAAFLILSPGPAPDPTPPPVPRDATPLPQDPQREDTEAKVRKPPTSLPMLEPGSVTKLRFRKGDEIRFEVRSPVDEELHVHAYDVTRLLPAGKRVVVEFTASITGIIEIELHGSGEQIGELIVEP